MTASARFYLGVSGLLAGAWCWVVYNYLYGHDAAGWSLCLFRNATGISCPACGTTRSLMAILHGQYKAGLLINPEGYLALAALVTGLLWLTADMSRGSRSLYRFFQKTEQQLKQQPLWLLLFFVLITANWIWNIYKHL